MMSIVPSWLAITFRGVSPVLGLMLGAQRALIWVKRAVPPVHQQSAAAAHQPSPVCALHWSREAPVCGDHRLPAAVLPLRERRVPPVCAQSAYLRGDAPDPRAQRHTQLGHQLCLPHRLVRRMHLLFLCSAEVSSREESIAYNCSYAFAAMSPAPAEPSGERAMWTSQVGRGLQQCLYAASVVLTRCCASAQIKLVLWCPVTSWPVRAA